MSKHIATGSRKSDAISLLYRMYVAVKRVDAEDAVKVKQLADAFGDAYEEELDATQKYLANRRLVSSTRLEKGVAVALTGAAGTRTVKAHVVFVREYNLIVSGEYKVVTVLVDFGSGVSFAKETRDFVGMDALHPTMHRFEIITRVDAITRTDVEGGIRLEIHPAADRIVTKVSFTGLRAPTNARDELLAEVRSRGNTDRVRAVQAILAAVDEKRDNVVVTSTQTVADATVTVCGLVVSQPPGSRTEVTTKIVKDSTGAAIGTVTTVHISPLPESRAALCAIPFYFEGGAEWADERALIHELDHAGDLAFLVRDAGRARRNRTLARPRLEFVSVGAEAETEAVLSIGTPAGRGRGRAVADDEGKRRPEDRPADGDEEEGAKKKKTGDDDDDDDDGPVAPAPPAVVAPPQAAPAAAAKKPVAVKKAAAPAPKKASVKRILAAIKNVDVVPEPMPAPYELAMLYDTMFPENIRTADAKTVKAWNGRFLKEDEGETRKKIIEVHHAMREKFTGLFTAEVASVHIYAAKATGAGGGGSGVPVPVSSLSTLASRGAGVTTMSIFAMFGIAFAEKGVDMVIRLAGIMVEGIADARQYYKLENAEGADVVPGCGGEKIDIWKSARTGVGGADPVTRRRMVAAFNQGNLVARITTYYTTNATDHPTWKICDTPEEAHAFAGISETGQAPPPPKKNPAPKPDSRVLDQPIEAAIRLIAAAPGGGFSAFAQSIGVENEIDATRVALAVASRPIAQKKEAANSIIAKLNTMVDTAAGNVSPATPATGLSAANSKDVSEFLVSMANAVGNQYDRDYLVEIVREKEAQTGGALTDDDIKGLKGAFGDVGLDVDVAWDAKNRQPGNTGKTRLKAINNARQALSDAIQGLVRAEQAEQAEQVAQPPEARAQLPAAKKKRTRPSRSRPGQNPASRKLIALRTSLIRALHQAILSGVLEQAAIGFVGGHGIQRSGTDSSMLAADIVDWTRSSAPNVEKARISELLMWVETRKQEIKEEPTPVSEFASLEECIRGMRYIETTRRVLSDVATQNKTHPILRTVHVLVRAAKNSDEAVDLVAPIVELLRTHERMLCARLNAANGPDIQKEQLRLLDVCIQAASKVVDFFGSDDADDGLLDQETDQMDLPGAPAPEPVDDYDDIPGFSGQEEDAGMNTEDEKANRRKHEEESERRREKEKLVPGIGRESDEEREKAKEKEKQMLAVTMSKDDDEDEDEDEDDEDEDDEDEDEEDASATVIQNTVDQDRVFTFKDNTERSKRNITASTMENAASMMKITRVEITPVAGSPSAAVIRFLGLEVDDKAKQFAEVSNSMLGGRKMVEFATTVRYTAGLIGALKELMGSGSTYNLIFLQGIQGHKSYIIAPQTKH